MNRYVLKTLGCKANLADSQLLEDDLQKQGWLPQVGKQEDVELCIINSCTVTNEADRQTRKLAYKLSQEHPNAKIVVTGCAAEVDPEGLANSKGIDFVVGNQNKNQLANLVLSKLKPTHITSDILYQNTISKPEILGTTKSYKDILSKHPHDREWPAAISSFRTPPTHLDGYSGKTRSFLKIQEGCNSFCTYCIIPYGRGPNRSLRPREILNQVKELVREGVQEIVITGTNIGDYGKDWGSDSALDDLLEMILNETDLPRLRISSLDPTEVSNSMLNLLKKTSRLCPHFHISLQSPNSRILRLMKRKYGYEEVKDCLFKISEIFLPIGTPFVGMDIITGFPGETEEEFNWGFEVLSSLPWSRLHVFPYSERAGTPATRLPGSVPQHKRIERARKLNQLSMDRLTRYYSSVLDFCRSRKLNLDSVLLEKGDKTWISGYSPQYLRVMVPHSSVVDRNQIVSVTPIDLMIDSKSQDVALFAQIAKS